MILNRHCRKQVKISTRIVALFALVFSFFTFSNVATAQDGKALFSTNCASCHHPLKDVTGPALKGAESRVPSKEWLYSWVKNSAALIASGDKHAVEIYNKYNKQAMTPFPNLTHEEIDAIFAYVESFSDKKPEAATAAGPVENSDNTWLYVLVTLILAILSIVLWRVNGSLERAVNDKQGLKSKRPIPIYRHKVFIATSGVILLALGGYWIANGSIEMGRQQNYMPEQPIFYSHKVHAGINQINCQYCHVGTEDSRQAIIPSANVCMNCHMQINEYTGDQLFDYEGNKINGTEEIHKLYDYAGWDKDAKKYKMKEDSVTIDAKPIPWVKIHNLPDHVYFNHSQHVAVGKVECQSCHGDIQNMDEVKQFSPLSMGWCINCHRETTVQFENNDYYKIFTKYHEEIKDGKRDKVTVDEVGGTDCQKCHY